MGLQKFNTHTIDSVNPKWSTSMQFQIYDLNKDILNVAVYDRRIFSPNIFLGKVEIKIIQIYREQVKENKENNPIIRMFRMNSVPTGKLMLKMSINIYKWTHSKTLNWIKWSLKKEALQYLYINIMSQFKSLIYLLICF